MLTSKSPLTSSHNLPTQNQYTLYLDGEEVEGSNQALMSASTITGANNTSSNIHHIIDTMNVSHNQVQQEVPMVNYTLLHEKLTNWISYLLTKTEFLNWCSYSIAVALFVPLTFFMLQGNTNFFLYVWLPVSLSLLFVYLLFAKFLSRDGRTWESLKLSVEHDEFYEPVTGSSSDFYKPRSLKDIHYSQGKWRASVATTKHSNDTSSRSYIKSDSDSNHTRSFTHIIKFRGVNLPAKTPTYGHNPDIFYSHKKQVSFIGTPIPLATAAQHFQRLSNYGFNLLRLVVTWEAVMHEGPGIIDNDYLNYLSSLIDIAAQYGLYVIIDPHQDVWSRFTGGDGAPWWTLDAAGFVTDDDSLHQSGSAFLHHLHDTELYPPAKMIWMSNYGKLATATMFTLFFAGDDYAPGIHVNSYYAKLYHTHHNHHNGMQTQQQQQQQVSIQKFLQKFYLLFIDTVAQKLKDKSNIIGFNSMNEPSNGYVGVKDLRKRALPMPFGTSHSYFDGMRMGAGEVMKRQFYSFPFTFHSEQIVNPEGIMAWKSPDHDIWRKVGVYGIDKNTGKVMLHRPHYFSLNGKDFINEYMLPLLQKIQTSIAGHNPKFILYAEPFIDVNDHQSIRAPQSLDCNKFAWAPHWYDGATLIFRKYFEWLAIDDEKSIPVVLPRFVESTFKNRMRDVKSTGLTDSGALHVVLGETGVPFDMDDANNYAASTKALDRIMRAIEANDLDFTLWNYFPDNTKQEGDNWCGEDLSVRMHDRNRALLALVRPYAYEISSDFKLVRQSFDPSTKKKKYRLTIKPIRVESPDSHLIYIYLPHLHYSHPLISANHGTWESYDKESQLLVWDCSDVLIDDLQREITLVVENAI
jgi:hypothetical protein